MRGIRRGGAREDSLFHLHPNIFQQVGHLIRLSSNMRGVDYPVWLEDGVDSDKPSHESPARRNFLRVSPIKEVGEKIDDNLRVPLSYDGE
jgi:hypothetical protein